MLFSLFLINLKKHQIKSYISRAIQHPFKIAFNNGNAGQLSKTF